MLFVWQLNVLQHDTSYYPKLSDVYKEKVSVETSGQALHFSSLQGYSLLLKVWQ